MQKRKNNTFFLFLIISKYNLEKAKTLLEWTLVPELSSGFLNVIYRGHIITDWLTCLDMSKQVPYRFLRAYQQNMQQKKIKVSSIRKSFFFQLYNNFTISIACDKIEAKKQNFCISSQKYIQFSSIKYYSRSKYEKYEKNYYTMKKSQCPPVFKTIRNKNQKTLLR